MNRRTALVALALVLAASVAWAQAPDSAAVPAATNFTRVDPNFATGGATSADQFAALRKLGFRTVINLRTAAEPGADLEGEAQAVNELGFQYISLPFSSTSPDAAVVDKFLGVLKDAAQPVYIHCRSGERANTLWLIKRVMVDGWTTERAQAEADLLKVRNQKLREFALAYLKDHQK